MFKSQKQNKILLYFFFLTFLTIWEPAFCENPESQLQEADSLFKVKKFTQAFTIYENLHYQGISTPSMYLKMAFIKEGLEDISNAMYYLNQYYYSTFDKRALKKMEMLAEEHHLAGYEYEDFEFFQNLLLKNRSWINALLILVSVLLFAFILYRRFSTQANVRNLAITLSLVTGLFIVFNNFSIVPDYAIISVEEAFVMKAPSAGAPPLTTLKKGNKLRVAKSGDMWVKVEYNDMTGYIRNHNLLVIPAEKSF